MRAAPDVPALLDGIKAGQRRALARAITLVESTRADHRAAARELLAALPPGGRSLRIGISGVPGAGKSTLLGLLAGLDVPSEGQVWLGGDELTALDEDGRARLRGAGPWIVRGPGGR